MTPEEWERCDDPAKMLGFLREVSRERALREESIPPDTGRVGERQVRLFAAACCRQLWPVLTDERSRAAVEGAERCGEDPATALAMDALHLAAGEVDYVDYPEAHDDDIIAAAQAWLDSGADRSRAAHWRTALAAQYAAHAAYCAAATAASACRAWRVELRDRWEDRATLRHMARVCAHKTAQSAYIAATCWSEDVAAALVAGWLVGQREEEEKFHDAACRLAKAVQANLLRDIAGSPFGPPPFLAPAVLAYHGGTVPKVARAIYDTRDFDHLPVLADALEEAGCTDPDMLAHCRGAGPHVLGCWVLDLILARE
jgi:hypothetical protein